MAHDRTRLTAAEAASLNHGFAQLERGDARGALTTVRGVLRAAPQAPDALHLQALCLRDVGDPRGAAESFDKALAGAPRNPDILSNYGAFLLRLKRPAEAVGRLKSAVAIEPKRPDYWINLSLAHLGQRELLPARAAAERAVALAPDNTRAFATLASAQRELGDLEGAEASLRKALMLDPKSGFAWTALGIVRRLIGDPIDSLECYAKARALGYATPELADAEASAHLDLGDFARALAAAQDLTRAAPAYVAGHILVAHIKWEHGVGGANDPLGDMERAVAEQPANTALRAAFVNALLEADRAEEALRHATALRKVEDSPPMAAAHAMALYQLGEIDAATKVFEEAAPTMSASTGFAIAYARQLVRVRRPDAAAHYALFAAQRSALEQEAWAMLSIAWRMLDDPREHWLCDYDRFILVDDVDPPAGYADRSAFIAALSETLTALHVAQHAPLNQSLRGGTQTSGSLFGRRDPAIVGARDAMRAAAEKMIARLPEDPGHPFLARRRASVRFSGSWSVRLRSAGRHVNHYHPKGWLSSAFYVQLPPSVDGDDPGHPGWIQFGQPPLQYETGLAPRRFERPKVGRLVLFPSYMWHGTVPFADETPRMTLAFDALPR